MLAFEKKEHVETIPTGIECMLGADIGGTNSNFGIFKKTDGKLQLLLSLHFKSQEIKNFTDVVKDVLDYLKNNYQISIRHSCFAGAGVVSEHRDRCKPTNLDFVIDAHEITKNTDLECATLANDFEIIGHGLKFVASENLVLVKKGNPRKNGARIILGAGTGLGKCILFWHESRGRYIPVPSEGGHADFAAQTQLDLNLINFIKKSENRSCNISWEDVLSGNGIQRTYRFFAEQNDEQNMHKKLKEQGLLPDKIFSARNLDEYAKQTYELYTILYARCAKNFALDALALGGVYIAGGILQKILNCLNKKSLHKNLLIVVNRWNF